MEAILNNCCGLDIHKSTIVGCILKTKHILDRTRTADNDYTIEIREFNAYPEGIEQLKQWIISNDCHNVAMESVGIYWIPIYEALETSYDGNIELIVTNARHMKNVPGKKTDIKDAKWIASLYRAGLLKASFIPTHEFRELRQLTRYRKNITHDISTQKNRIEKTLQQAGFKLSNILSDIFGTSGRNLINVLIHKGCLTTKDVDVSVVRISKEKISEIKIAITGTLSEHQREFLKIQMTLLDQLIAHLSLTEDKISSIAVKFATQIAQLETIPGISTTSAISVLAEIGIDMSKFPTSDHFCSWAGLSPGCNESAGKKKALEFNMVTPILRA